MMPASSAQTTTVWVIEIGSAMSPPIVLATPVPRNAPPKLKTAASMTAVRGDSTLVETTVAIALAVS